MNVTTYGQTGNYQGPTISPERVSLVNAKWDRNFFNETLLHISPHDSRGVEEKLKWRQDERAGDVDGETNNKTANNSPTGLLSRTTNRRDSQNENNFDRKMTAVPKYFIMLARSPPRNAAYNDEESDSSTYDKSFHCRETDICQDSTDSDSSSTDSSAASFRTEAIATVEVVEYEVASASDDEDSFVNNSSSGTDDFIMAAAVTARAVYETSSPTSEFADSEESDSDKLFDTELSAADYWKCIQCKNSQNNPMFRMCEKCYKTRRTHFPPRPKFRKKRLNRNRKTAAALLRARHSSSATTELSSYNNSPARPQPPPQDDEVSKRLSNNAIGNDGLKINFQNGGNNYKKRKLNYTNNKSQLNSAAETSGDNSSDVDHRNKHLSLGNRKRKSPLRIKRDNNISTNQSSSGQSSLSPNRLESSLSRKRRSSSNDRQNEIEKKLRLGESSLINKIDNASDTDDTPLTIVGDSQKDSGISSAQSSQEPTSSSLSDERSIGKDDYLGRCSQETVTDALDNKDLVELEIGGATVSEQSTSSSRPIVESRSTLTPEKNNYPDLTESNLARSVSDCSSSFLNNNLAAEAVTMNVNSLDSNFSTYGSCIICLSGPKNGVFVHSNLLHLCSCYKCAVKIWTKYKRCPVCNSSVKNVLKLFVH